MAGKSYRRARSSRGAEPEGKFGPPDCHSTPGELPASGSRCGACGFVAIASCAHRSGVRTMTRRPRARARLIGSVRAAGNPKTKKAPEVFEASGANLWGWAFVTRSFPAAHAWTRSLSRVVCFPTPLSAACGYFGLMAGPFRPLPAGIFRVRSFRPVRTPPAGGGSPDVVRTRLQFLTLRVGTLAAGTAPASGRTLAPRYGSDLLSLRLRSLFAVG